MSGGARASEAESGGDVNTPRRQAVVLSVAQFALRDRIARVAEVAAIQSQLPSPAAISNPWKRVEPAFCSDGRPPTTVAVTRFLKSMRNPDASKSNRPPAARSLTPPS